LAQAPSDHEPGRLGPEFRKLWAASAVSNLGDGVGLVAAPLLAAALTRDPTLVAGLVFAQRLPWLLFALISGAFVDRLDRRRVMATVITIRAGLIGFLGIAVLLGVASIPLLYVIFFLLGIGETLFDTAASAIIPALVPPDDLPKANARLAGTMTVTNQFAGPPLGGFLFAAAAAFPFLLGAGGLAAGAAVLLAVRGSFKIARPVTATPANLRVEIVEGIKWLGRHRLLRSIALTLGLLDIAMVAWNSVLVLFALDRLGLGPEGYGVLIATYGVGGVLGSVVGHRIIEFLGAGWALRTAIIIEAAGPAALALSTSPLVAGAVLGLFGFHALVWGSLLTSLRQELTPARLRGRVVSVFRLIDTAAPGALLGGLLASAFGLTAPFWLHAVTGVLLIPLVWSTFSDVVVADARNEADGFVA
jgi:MFS family permease